MKVLRNIKRYGSKHLMMLPAVIITIIFSYCPVVGVVLAFQKYSPKNGFFGSKWVGLQHFRTIFSLPDFGRVVRNTIEISAMKIVAGIVFAVIFALFMHELKNRRFKTIVQTMTLFPHYVSWVVLAAIFVDIFSNEGIVNQVIISLGLPEIDFFTNDSWFRVLLVSTDVWKGFAYNSIIYLSALGGIDNALYEAAYMDGAGRWKCAWHISLPCIGQIVAMTAILAVGGILSAGFDQIYNMYNTTVLDTADVLDTYVYRIGLEGGQYSLGTAIGLFKSAVGAILFGITNWIAYRFTDYRIL